MKKDRTKYLWYSVAIGALIIFALLILSSILDIGEKLRNISNILEYTFYALVAFIIIFVIIRPIVIIVKSPSLSIITATEKNSNKAYNIYKKVAKNIVKYNDVSKEETIMLTQYKNKEELLINLNYVFEKSIKGKINGIIIRNAKIVMISTAICQSARYDMATSFAVNLKMIKEEVMLCGFRPSFKNLSKLTINVFSTALIAEGLDNLTLSDVMPRSIMNSINEIPLLGKTLDSIMDGIANAILTIRIGCVARRYLYSDGNVVTKEDIRKNAYKETLLILPEVIKSTVAFFPNKVLKFFSKKEESET